jgi:putative methylase
VEGVIGRSTLETQLAVVAGFDDPRPALEQYPTPPDLAAHVIHVADLREDLEGRTILDLGAGTGMLALGAALCGPDRVVGVEIDRAPLETARANARRVGTTTPIDWVQADATRLPVVPAGPTTVVMNPPFGAQNGARGADRGFLASAARVADVSYSVHNEGSREFVEAFAADQGGRVTDAYAADLTVDRQFEFHQEARRDIPVEVYRIRWDTADDADGGATASTDRR